MKKSVRSSSKGLPKNLKPDIREAYGQWATLPEDVRKEFHVEFSPIGHMMEIWRKRDDGLGWSIAFISLPELTDDGFGGFSHDDLLSMYVVEGGRLGKGGSVVESPNMEGVSRALLLLTRDPLSADSRAGAAKRLKSGLKAAKKLLGALAKGGA